VATPKEIALGIERVAVVHSPDDPGSPEYSREGETQARVLGIKPFSVAGQVIE
jgi:hypothetical protein